MSTEPAFDAGAPWQLHPSVAVRAERFGALLYHFGTRRLSFLKDRRLLDVVEHLACHPSALDACRAAGVQPPEQAAFTVALARLAEGDMLVPGGPR
ncbi:MAG: mycofactocin biosynthesis chaperone MftB [Actinomycetota bacterium]|nr:mycofactocin biosynthesis chaperone MftB [Actinomycetota bacterium]